MTRRRVSLIVVVLFGMLQHTFSQGSQTDAVKQLRAKAEQGDAEAQFNLGYMYAKGQGVTQNYGEAVKWYRQAAEQGDPDAQSGLGVMYDLGEGVPKDAVQAVNWFRKAAEQGHATAQNNLGVAYRDGLGVSKDWFQAVLWYRKAAEQGLATAQNNLGVAYRDGLGGPKDAVQAVNWFRKAAEQGDAGAQSNLATIVPGVMSGRIFAITQGGDIKPARLARVFLLYEDPFSAFATAASTFSTEHSKDMAAYTEELRKNPSIVIGSCQRQLSEYAEALSATVSWAKNNGKMAQLSSVDTDEEGNFKIATLPGWYRIMAQGRAGFNDAVWGGNLEVKSGVETTMKLSSPEVACLTIGR